MSDIVPIITQMASVEAGIFGIQKAYDTTPSGVDLPLPCVINLPFEGEIRGGEGEYELMGVRETIHRVKVQVLCSLQSDLQDSELIARPYLRRFVGTFDHNKSLGGTAGIQDVMVEKYRYGVIKLRDGDPGYLGWELITRVTEVETVVYSATGAATT